MTDRSEWIDAAMAVYRLGLAERIEARLVSLHVLHEDVPRVARLVRRALREGGTVAEVLRQKPLSIAGAPPWQERKKRDTELMVEVEVQRSTRVLRVALILAPLLSASTPRGYSAEIQRYELELPEVPE